MGGGKTAYQVISNIPNNQWNVNNIRIVDTWIGLTEIEENKQDQKSQHLKVENKFLNQEQLCAT